MFELPLDLIIISYKLDIFLITLITYFGLYYFFDKQKSIYIFLELKIFIILSLLFYFNYKGKVFDFGQFKISWFLYYILIQFLIELVLYIILIRRNKKSIKIKF
ncbi:hypothetical protein CSB11_00145 [Candidatus Campbellbacteria bacterium]|nr:MAG: hypothetical protein CSB11_00145 [Candidatus Campbellbacteria bacterium]